MSNKSQVDQNDLFEIFKKAFYISNPESLLSESSISNILTEEISQEALSKVRDAIRAADRQIEDTEKYLKSLDAKGMKLSSLPTIVDQVKFLKDALDTAASDVVNVSFESGAVSKFLGQNLTVPQLTQAAIAIQSQASNFSKSLMDTLESVIKNFSIIIKDKADAKTPIKDLLGQPGLPTLDKVAVGIQKGFDKKATGGVFGKVSSFLGRAAQTGATKKIMSLVPKVDAMKIGKEIADSIVELSVDDLLKSPVPDILEINPSDVVEIAKEAEQEVKDSPKPPPLPDEVSKSSGNKDMSPEPENEKEAEAEQKASQEKIKVAVQAASKEKKQSPKDAALGAVDSWVDSLSQSAQKDIKAANRLVDLKDIVGQALDDSAKAVESEVAAAVQVWRDDHEEQLIRNKRFSKKSFDSLQSMIPKLAAFVLKAQNESSSRLTNTSVRKAVYNYLTKSFLGASNKNLSESHEYTEESMISYRMNKLAGLIND